jgi:haloacetate dehalogenase
VLALWSARDGLEEWFDVLEVWRGWADDVTGRALDSGHHLAEERRDEVAAELRAFFGGQ